jgi:CHRD domain
MSRGIAAVAVLATLAVLWPAPAAAEVHKVRLDGLQEVPTVSTPASGQLVLDIHHDETQIDYQLTYEGISTPVRFAHIHIGAPGTTGGIVLFLCNNQGVGAARHARLPRRERDRHRHADRRRHHATTGAGHRSRTVRRDHHDDPAWRRLRERSLGPVRSRGDPRQPQVGPPLERASSRRRSADWTAQQVVDTSGWDRDPPRYPIRDRDSRYGDAFDRRLRGLGVRQLRTPLKAPRANALAERWVRSARTEGPDQVFIVTDTQGMRSSTGRPGRHRWTTDAADLCTCSSARRFAVPALSTIHLMTSLITP